MTGCIADGGLSVTLKQPLIIDKKLGVQNTI